MEHAVDRHAGSNQNPSEQGNGAICGSSLAPGQREGRHSHDGQNRQGLQQRHCGSTLTRKRSNQPSAQSPWQQQERKLRSRRANGEKHQQVIQPQ
jgi:hypothetical protein